MKKERNQAYVDSVMLGTRGSMGSRGFLIDDAAYRLALEDVDDVSRVRLDVDSRVMIKAQRRRAK